MADKVGTSSFFVRIILVGFLLALLLVGALLSIFYRGTGSTFILIALVIIPALGLLVMYFLHISVLFRKDKAENIEEEFFVPPLSDAKTIVIYGSEFADPYYKQLTMPHFVGKASPKQSNKTRRKSATRNKPVMRSTYADYTDTYNGVTQGQMLLDNWLDVLRDEPVVVEQNDREATLAGDLTDEVLDTYRAEIANDNATPTAEEAVSAPATSEQKLPRKSTPKERRSRDKSTPRKRRETEISPATPIITDEQKTDVKNTTVIERKAVIKRERRIKGSRGRRSPINERVVGEPIIAKTSEQAAVAAVGRIVEPTTGRNKPKAKPSREYKIRIHKKPEKDKRDEYIYIKQPRVDTNQPIKSLLLERFAHLNTNTTHSASQELLNKMRRDNTRR